MDLESRSHQIRHYRDYTGTQSLSFYQEAEGRGGCGLWGNAFLFTTVATYLAIWLANLPLPIRVQTTLLASMCHAQKIQFLWRWHCVKSKSNVEFSVVYTFMENDMRHHSEGYRMVPSNLKVLAKFGLCPNCSQKLHECSLARTRKIFASARMLGFSLKFPAV